MSKVVLTLNAGSSTLKFALFNGEIALARGQIEGSSDRLDDVLLWVEANRHGAELAAVGHRVVHGGARFAAPVLIDAEILGELEGLVRLAPLHQPHNLAGIRAISQLLPDLPQVACFDTAFHHGMPDIATRFALPAEITGQGVRRYGFHGLSYEYIAGVLKRVAPALAAGRVIVAHLGNGASLCAMRDGVSIDTTMGFTALDGLMMGTRCGALDPGVVLHLLRQPGMNADRLEDLLYHRSGLLGVSGESGDMRRLLQSRSPRARLAIELYVYRIVREIGALTSSLGGLDGLVFTAGIGEHAAEIREKVVKKLGWLGPGLDVRVIPTDEERMIARHTRSVLAIDLNQRETSKDFVKSRALPQPVDGD